MDYYIVFQGEINKQPSLDLINALLEADNHKETDHITLLLSSVGGAVYYGFNIATIIQNLKKPIRIHATNEISSIANVIYLSASERSAESYAKFFFHGASTSGEGYDFNIDDLIERSSAIKVENERIAKFIFEATSMPLNEIKKLMVKRKSLSVEEASNQKIVQVIKKEKIPPDSFRKNVIYV